MLDVELLRGTCAAGYRARARGARSREVRENHLNGPTTIEAVQQRSNNIITRFVGGVVK